MRARRPRARVVAITAIMGILLLAPGSATAADPPFVVVANGLHSPRGLTFGANGRLYVAQSGDAAEEESSILEIRNPSSASPTTQAVVTGLASIGDEGEFVGLDGISARGNSIFGIMALSPQIAGDDAFGNLLQISPAGGHVRTIANVGSFDFEWTGDHPELDAGGETCGPVTIPCQFPDANPYGVLALPGHLYVVDAGANTLNEVRPDGTVEVLAFFPNTLLSDAVPTCVAQGPDGALYIGTLALVDSLFLGPSAIVYRVDPDEVDPSDMDAVLNVATPWATGLFPINGCAFGPDGAFYASQLFTNPSPDVFANPMGDVVKIPWATPSVHTPLTDGALSFAGGVAVGPNGNVYVANGTAFVAPGAGQVVRLTP